MNYWSQNVRWHASPVIAPLSYLYGFLQNDFCGTAIYVVLIIFYWYWESREQDFDIMLILHLFLSNLNCGVRCDHVKTNDVLFLIILRSIWNHLKLKSLIIDLPLIRWPCCRGMVTVECVFSYVWARMASEDTIVRVLSLRDIVQWGPAGNAHVQQHCFLSRRTWYHRIRYVYQTLCCFYTARMMINLLLFM